VKEASGYLNKATDKKGDKSPDYWGYALLNGQKLKVSGWINENDEGKKYLALRFQPHEDKPAAKPAAKPAQRSAKPDFNDDIPF
jgi:hypothetical protein